MTAFRWVAALLVVLALGTADAGAQNASDKDEQNRAKSGERAAEYSTPEYQAELDRREQENAQSTATTPAADPERNFATVYAVGGMACAGDVRLHDFAARGRDIVEPLLWTACNGSTVSGHVWATAAAPRAHASRAARCGSRSSAAEVGASRGRRVTVRLGGLPRGTARVVLRITGRRAGRTVRVTQRRTYRLCTKR